MNKKQIYVEVFDEQFCLYCSHDDEKKAQNSALNFMASIKKTNRFFQRLKYDIKPILNASEQKGEIHMTIEESKKLIYCIETFEIKMNGRKPMPRGFVKKTGVLIASPLTLTCRILKDTIKIFYDIYKLSKNSVSARKEKNINAVSESENTDEDRSITGIIFWTLLLLSISVFINKELALLSFAFSSIVLALVLLVIKIKKSG
jgi:hypothetical protein